MPEYIMFNGKGFLLSWILDNPGSSPVQGLNTFSPFASVLHEEQLAAKLSCVDTLGKPPLSCVATLRKMLDGTR